jgi:hypothetical protein
MLRESLALKKLEDPSPISTPVYSLATLNRDGSTNMNIVTYATPVSIQPQRNWVVSLYKDTLSKENFEREGFGILQASIVPPAAYMSSFRMLALGATHDADAAAMT